MTTKRTRKPNQCVDGNIIPSALDPTDVRPMHISLLRQCLLRATKLLPSITNIIGKGFSQVFIHGFISTIIRTFFGTSTSLDLIAHKTVSIFFD